MRQPTRIFACLAFTLIAAFGVAPEGRADPPQSPIEQKLMGMSTTAATWDTQLAQVGACGIEVRRIFGHLSADGTGGKSGQIEDAVDAGMMPIISYKVPSVASLNRGSYDSWIAQTKLYLDSLGTQVTATFWHEPHGDMTPLQFRQGSTRFLALQSDTIAVGPILNGWLLDRRVNDWASYTSTSLLRSWDFLGFDTYPSGSSATNPGLSAARAIPAVETWLDQRGFPDLPMGIGEYNGFTPETIAETGMAALSTPEVWFASLWNSVGPKSNVIDSPEEIAAFRSVLDDPRAFKDPPC